VSTSNNADLREEIRQLNHEKDASCRDAWKKCGEVISILANIARKVDRLTSVLDGGPATADESLRDTAIDLMVSNIKRISPIWIPSSLRSCSSAATSAYPTATVQTDLSTCYHRLICPGQIPSA
jgi:hypothetical protein